MFTREPHNQCHRCKYCAGVVNAETKCLKLKKVVKLTEACRLMDDSAMPGKVLHMDEFNKKIKQS